MAHDFKDFNFKLVIMDSILDNSPSFEKELNKLKEKHSDELEEALEETLEPIEEILEFFKEVKLKDSDLDKVECLTFDGGLEIYFLIRPFWDGEDSFFDVKSIEGFEKLKNLKTVYWCSICNENLLKPLQEKGINVI